MWLIFPKALEMNCQLAKRRAWPSNSLDSRADEPLGEVGSSDISLNNDSLSSGLLDLIHDSLGLGWRAKESSAGKADVGERRAHPHQDQRRRPWLPPLRK